MTRTTTLATIAQMRDALTEAAVLLGRLLEQQEQMFGTDGPALLPTLIHLARVDLAVGLRAKVVALAERAEALAARDPVASAIEMEQLRGALASDPAEAEARMRHAITLAEAPMGSQRARGITRAQLGALYLSQHRFAEAKTELEIARTQLMASEGPRSMAVGSLLSALASAADGAGDAAEAARYSAAAQKAFGNAHALPSLWL